LAQAGKGVPPLQAVASFMCVSMARLVASRRCGAVIYLHPTDPVRPVARMERSGIRVSRFGFRLCRTVTSLFYAMKKHMDGRDKPGHDGGATAVRKAAAP